MDSRVAEIIAKIEIDRAFGKSFNDEHLAELFRLEDEGFDVQSALGSAKNHSTLGKYLAYIEKKPEDFCAIHKAITARAEVFAQVGKPVTAQVSQVEAFQVTCENPAVRAVLATSKGFFVPLDKVMISVRRGEFAARCDQFGRAGYDRVDSPSGKVFGALKLWLIVDFLRIIDNKKRNILEQVFPVKFEEFASQVL